MTHEHKPHTHFNVSIIVTDKHFDEAVRGIENYTDLSKSATGELYLDLAIYLARIEVVEHGTYEVVQVDDVFELTPAQGGGWRVNMHVKKVEDDEADDGGLPSTLANRINTLEDFIKWAANTTHQARHTLPAEASVGWRECTIATCRESVQILEPGGPL